MKAKRKAQGELAAASNEQAKVDLAKKVSRSAMEYFRDTPPDFNQTADVELCVDGERLPAHSQFLANQSRFMLKLFEDLETSFSKTAKFVVPEQTLATFKAEDVRLFLEQVYDFSNKPLKSAEEAHQLSLLAELFDSPKLRKRCVCYLEDNASSFLIAQVHENGCLKWLLFAEKYGISQLLQECVDFTADNYDDVKGDGRMKELRSNTLVKILDCMHVHTADVTLRLEASLKSQAQLQKQVNCGYY